MINRSLLIVGVASLVLACGPTEPTDESVASAPVVAGQALHPQSATSDEKAENETLVLSADNTTIEFVGSKLVGSHPGGFKDFKGEVSVTAGDVTTAKLSVVIQMASVWSDSEKLTKHLKSADFFGVDQFPTAQFNSQTVKQSSKEGMTHDFTGMFEFHGVKKEITIPVSLNL